MQAIVDTIIALGEWLLSIVKEVFVAVWDMFTDCIAYIADKLLSFAVTLLSAIDVSGLMNVSAWGSLPSEVLNICGLIGLGHCMGVIAAAIVIRLGLQLIPFVRLGS